MTLKQIYDLINLISLKENNGNLFKIYNMNIAIKGIDSDFIRGKIREFERYQDNPQAKPSVLAGRNLDELLTINNVAITTGSGSLPSDYGYFKSGGGEYASALREVELVTEEDRIHRLAERFSKPPERYPFCVIRGTSLYVWPKSINPVSIVYYQLPTTPYLDWYTNSNDREVELDASETVILSASETGSEGQTQVSGEAITAVAVDYIELSGDLRTDFTNATTFVISGSTGNDGTYTISAVSLVAGNTRIEITTTFPDLTVDGTVGSVTLTSQTVELPYDKDLHLEYTYKILSMLGIRIDYPGLVQYAQGMQNNTIQQ